MNRPYLNNSTFFGVITLATRTTAIAIGWLLAFQPSPLRHLLHPHSARLELRRFCDRVVDVRREQVGESCLREVEAHEYNP